MAAVSDPSLLAEVRTFGQFDTNACFQCGSCTVTCNLTDSSASFPRRIVRYALLGLREPLQGGLEPWLCYYCGDCSAACPRQAEPAEAMMTLRRFLTAQYDWTGLAARIYRSRPWGIGVHLTVGAAVLVLALLYHLYVVGLQLADLASLRIGIEHMFDTITVFTRSVFAIAFFFLISNALRMYWLTMRGNSAVKIPAFLYLVEARTLLLHAITQIRFRDCSERSHWARHLILAAGCVLMFLLVLFFLKWFQTDHIYPLYHPQRWLGYLATAALIYGAGDILIGRIKKRGEMHKFSGPSDWLLPVLLLLTAVTGIAIHILRYSGLPLVAHFTYALHLAIAVPLVVIEIPFGKASHMIYRPLAIYFQTVKEKALLAKLVQEPVVEDAA